MFIFWALAIVALIVGAILWHRSRNIVAVEFLAAGGAALLLAGIFHLSLRFGMVSDTQMLSSWLVAVNHEPAWTEKVTYTTSDSKGRTHRHTVYVHHPDSWSADTSIKSNFSISGGNYRKYKTLFELGGARMQSHFRFHVNQVGGDMRNYSVTCPLNVLIPCVESSRYENPILAGPSAFSFEDIPESIKLPKYPEVSDNFRSNRLCMNASRSISFAEWDKLNARLGNSKKVNVILVGFPDNYGSRAAHQLRARWLGGKKNDLVLCYGKGWAEVFGWTDSELCKSSLRTLLLNGPVDETLIPKIEKEIRDHYVIKDFHDFDYLLDSLTPPTWSVIVFLSLLVIFQVLLFYVFSTNDLRKTRHTA